MTLDQKAQLRRLAFLLALIAATVVALVANAAELPIPELAPEP